MFNKKVTIKNIVSNTPNKIGEISESANCFVVKFLWSTKRIFFDQITKVRAYSTVDFGLENHFKFLEMHTKDKSILSFDPNQPSHCDFVSNFIKQHFKKVINLQVEDFPPDGADADGNIL